MSCDKLAADFIAGGSVRNGPPQDQTAMVPPDALFGVIPVWVGVYVLTLLTFCLATYVVYHRVFRLVLQDCRWPVSTGRSLDWPERPP